MCDREIRPESPHWLHQLSTQHLHILLCAVLSVKACVIFPLHHFLPFMAGVIEEMSERCETISETQIQRSIHAAHALFSLFQPLKWTLTRHTYHMNQFFLVWPTSAIQTPCVCTRSEGVFCFRKKPQLEHGTTSLYTLFFHVINMFFQGFVLQNRTMWPKLKCQTPHLNMTNFWLNVLCQRE